MIPERGGRADPGARHARASRRVLGGAATPPTVIWLPWGIGSRPPASAGALMCRRRPSRPGDARAEAGAGGRERRRPRTTTQRSIARAGVEPARGKAWAARRRHPSRRLGCASLSAASAGASPRGRLVPVGGNRVAATRAPAGGPSRRPAAPAVGTWSEAWARSLSSPDHGRRRGAHWDGPGVPAADTQWVVGVTQRPARRCLGRLADPCRGQDGICAQSNRRSREGGGAARIPRRCCVLAGNGGEVHPHRSLRRAHRVSRMIGVCAGLPGRNNYGPGRHGPSKGLHGTRSAAPAFGGAMPCVPPEPAAGRTK